jgi:class 3 adenylate cyclase/tetratricopeptide (TPR) repeat protein
LARACASCGAQLSATAKFCSECAHPAGPAAPPTPHRFGAPDAYTPKHLAERILTSKTALEGERKQVTVLFADLKGSMELLAERDPEEARKLLDPVLELMMEAVHRYEGTVNQVMGDGIMALFGAPLAHEDHAVRACYAALRMQEAVRGYAEEARRGFGVRIQIRVGLNSGEVVVRAIGSDLRMDYSAVGQTTHLAARMEQLAEPGTSLLTPATLELAEGYVTVRALGPVPIKGLVMRVEVHELMGASAARSRLQATAARGFTKFAGRSAELQHLARVLGLAGGGHGQVVTVMGEAGMGKSRLVWELTHSHRTQGWLILEASSVSHGKATAYLPVIDVLRTYYRIEPEDDPRRIREKLAGRLLALNPALLGSLPAFLALFGVSTNDPTWDALDGPLRRYRTLEAIRQLFLEEARVQPLLIVVEDLHWMDGETQAVLDALVESLPTARILLLTNFRPEYTHSWGRKTYCAQIRLDPLPDENTEELLDALLGADPGLEKLRSALIERTEGNPFFLEESVRSLVDSGVLAGERGAYRVTRESGSVVMPATVHSVLAARIDRLPSEHKRLLQAASVIGKDLPVALLAALGLAPMESVHRSLAKLQEAEFLYQTRLFPDAEYTFKHALTHEVTYGSLLQERRRALHGEILSAMERLHAGRFGEHLERLALHAIRSESWDKAAAYAAAAGARAMSRWSLREARAIFEQGLGALAHLPPSPENLRRAVQLHLDVRGCLVLLGEIPPMFEHLHAAEGAAAALGDPVLRALVSENLAHTHGIVGQHQKTLELSQDALDLLRGTSERRLEAMAHVLIGQARYSLGQPAPAAELLGRGLTLAAEDPRPMPHMVVPTEIFGARLRAQVLAELGRFEEAADLAREAIERARAVNHPYGLANALSASGMVCARQGRFEAALPPLEEGLQLSRTLGFSRFVATFANQLAEARVQLGRSAEAEALLDDTPSRVLPTFVQPLTLLLLGRSAEARRLIDQSILRHREHAERGAEAWCLWLMGEIAVRESSNDLAIAANFLREASLLANDCGMRPLVAHCHLGLGRLSGRTGNRGRAHEHLTTATTMYGEMGMTYWRERAEAEVRGLA